MDVKFSTTHRNETPQTEGQYDNEVLEILNNKREYPPITDDEEEGEETYTSLSKIYSHHQHATHEEMKARELEREGPKEWSNKLENERVYVTDNGYLVRGHPPEPPEAPTNVQVIERVEKIDNVEKNQDKGKVGRELEREALKAKESRSRSDGKERKEEVNHAKRDIGHKPTNTKREKNEVVRSKSIDNRDSRHQTKKKEDKLVRKENAATAKSNSKPVERINSKRREVELKERTSPQVPVQAFEHNDDSISNISQINSSFSHSPPLSPSRSPAMVQDETNPSGDDMITNTNEIYQKEPSCNSEDLRLFEMEFDQSTTQFKKSILKSLLELHKRNSAKVAEEAGKERDKAIRLAESHESALRGVCSELDALKSSSQHQHAVVMNLADAYHSKII